MVESIGDKVSSTFDDLANFLSFDKPSGNNKDDMMREPA